MRAMRRLASGRHAIVQDISATTACNCRKVWLMEVEIVHLHVLETFGRHEHARVSSWHPSASYVQHGRRWSSAKARWIFTKSFKYVHAMHTLKILFGNHRPKRMHSELCSAGSLESNLLLVEGRYVEIGRFSSQDFKLKISRQQR